MLCKHFLDTIELDTIEKFHLERHDGNDDDDTINTSADLECI